VLLVDTGYEEQGRLIRRKLEEMGLGAPRYIINTHGHRDHTGGNRAFDGRTVVVGHAALWTKLHKHYHVLQDYPAYVYPQITFDQTLSLHFNGEEIQLTALPGAHEDNDIVVHFTRSGVVHMGDLAYRNGFPSIDGWDCDVRLFPGVVQKALDLFPEGTLFVAGHTSDLDRRDLEAFQRMLADTIGLVASHVAQGQSLEWMRKNHLLKPWEDFGKEGYVRVDEWLTTIVNDLRNVRQKDRESLIPLVYEVYRKQGVKAALAVLEEKQVHEANRYRVDEFTAWSLAEALIRKGKLQDARAFLEPMVEAWPRSEYHAYFLLELGKLYHALHEKERALKTLKRALREEPDSVSIRDWIRKVKEA